MSFRFAAFLLCLSWVGLTVTSVSAQSTQPAFEYWKIPSPSTLSSPQGDAVPAATAQSYPDEIAFDARRIQLIRALSSVDLQSWRRGYFKGGDPGKYLPHHAMARLLMDPQNQEVIKLMNDRRSFREHYHFASANWGRYYPLIFEKILTEKTKKGFNDKAFKYANYLKPHGTENHRTQNFSSASVLPWYTNHGLSHQSKENTLKIGKQLLKDYVKGLYMAGQGEWDSSTYVMFDVNSLLNIYDFAKDEETRLIASAGLDWLVAAYALKYTDGVYIAPNQRGFASGPMNKIADQTGWLWWGASAQVDEKRMKGWRYSLPPALSAWRPNEVITRLAKKQVKLPFEQRNSKPNYYYGLEIKPKLSQYHESLWVTPSYSLGTLWNGHGSQITRMQLVVKTKQGAVVFTGGHPRRSDHTGRKTDWGYQDGNGRYDQAMQTGGTHITLSKVPKEEAEVRASFFSVPEGLSWKTHGLWMVAQLGETYMAIRGVSGEVALGKTQLTPKQIERNKKSEERGRSKRYAEKPVLLFPDKEGVTGFILETSNKTDYASFAEFLEALDQTSLQDKSEQGIPSILYTNLKGEVIKMKYNTAASTPHVAIDKEVIEYGNWSIYSGPYLNQSPGLLKISDGVKAFTIDFRGDLPIYKNLMP